MLRIFPFLLLLVGCALQPITDPRRPNPETEPTMVPTAIAIEKPTYVVERGSVTSQLFKSGRITPVSQNQVSFAIDGRLAEIVVDEGEMVSAGDVVAVLDTVELERGLASAETDLTLAQQQLALAQANQATNHRRAEIGVELAQLDLELAEEEAGDTPTAEQRVAVERLRLNLELAELSLSQIDAAVDPALSNQVAQAQIRLERMQTEIAQSTLVAPTSGTVMVVNFTEGDSVGAQETVFVIADLTSVEAQVTLFERDLEQLSEGMSAFGIFPSRPEASYPMTVRQLPYPYGSGAEGNSAENVVRLSFDAPTQQTELTIGERIEIAIQLESRDDVLWLPPAAIREFNGRLFVVAQEGEAQKRLDVKIGLQSENQIEIVSGVTEGQLVVGP